MSNIIVDGFGAYGVGNSNFFSPQQAVIDAMQSGIWAYVPSYISLESLPWDAANLDIYMAATFYGAPAGEGPRRVFPQTLAVSRYSFYYAVSSLPGITEGHIFKAIDGDGITICGLRCTSTGALQVVNSAAAQLAITAGPVIVAQTAAHLEIEVDTDARSVKIYSQGIEVLNATGLNFSSNNHTAQCEFLTQELSSGGSPIQFLGHLIIRDSNGTQNNTFPIGDRKVATLFVNNDDVAHQGWSAHPIHRFGNGVLDLTEFSNTLVELVAAVTTNDNAHTDLGAGDFTIEGQFRFQRLPTGAEKMVLWGKWDETNNKRSYQFYLGGPDLENGLLVFRTSTDGQNGTVAEKFKWAWTPDVATWYEIVFERIGGELVCYIDGVAQGLPIEDPDVYYAGTELFALGIQTIGANIVPDTNYRGWIDEFRFTKGLGRYPTNYAPRTTAFPRNADDPNWGAVVWLSSFDEGVVADDGPLGLPLVAWNGAAAITPDDGAFFFQLMNQNHYPFDDNFIQAAFIPATVLLTYVGQPTAGDTFTIGTKDGSVPAVYTWVAGAPANPFEVGIGASQTISVSNAVAAVLAGAGSGVAYGAGTTANSNVVAALEPSNQLLFTALVAGVIGNALTSTTTGASGSFATATMTGGLDIPPYSQYGFQRLPSDTSLVDSITIATRQWKTDAGVATSQISLVGPNAGVLNGGLNQLSTTPSVTMDTYEADPDNPSGSLSPTAVLLSKIRVNRTA